MMAHTPGPWEYIPSTEHHGPYVVSGWGYGDICDCYTNDADANARLIAASPHLLTAITGILNRYVALANSGDCGSWNQEDEPEVKAARAAIEKATGEQPHD